MKINPTIRNAVILFLILFSITIFSGCGNDYYGSVFAENQQYRLHLGEPVDEVGIAAEGKCGATRATTDSPAAIVNNPAGLAHLDATTFEGNAVFSSRFLSWEIDGDAPAQSNTRSFSKSFAGVGTPLFNGRIAIGAAYWTPYDFNSTIGSDAASGKIESSGGIHSGSPAIAVKLGPAKLGIATDIMFGSQTYATSGTATETPFDYSFFGYDVRGGIQLSQPLNDEVSVDFGAIGRLGARTGMGDYDMNYPPQVGLGLALHLDRITGEVDFVYNFTERMSSTEPATANGLDNTTLDTYYLLAGGTIKLKSGVVRVGYAYKPRLISDDGHDRVYGRYYSIGGGWQAFNNAGRVELALRYGTRGSLKSNQFDTTYTELSIGGIYGL